MPPLQIVNSTLMALLLLITCVVTVVIFKVAMDATITTMSDTTESTAYSLINQMLKERVDLTASRLNHEFIQPPMEMVRLGVHMARQQQMNLSDQHAIFGLTRTLLSTIVDSNFLVEAWVLKYESKFLFHGTKGLKPKAPTDPFRIRYYLEEIDTATTYIDRIPLPDERDAIATQTVKPSARFINDEFLDENDNIARKWTTPQTDPEGILEIGYGLPVYPGVPAYDNVWILTEFMMPFIRPLLQSMVDGVEVYTEDTYDAPTYAPHTNESILCLAERVTGLLVECSHGFGAVLSKTGGTAEAKWDREVARISPHPVVGPAFDHLYTQYGTLQNVDDDDLVIFTTTGTDRFPIPPTQFFLRSTPIVEDGLDWLAVAITPYDSVMKQINDDTSDSKDKANKATVLSIVVAAVICLVAIGVVLGFTHAFTKPISELNGEMQQVESMNLEGIPNEAKSSFFTEITQMNKSFREMVRMLIQYRAYLPAHLQAISETTEEETVSEDNKKQDVPSASSHSRSMKSSKQTELIKTTANLFALELTDKTTCTLITFTLNKADSLTAAAAKAAYNTLLEDLILGCSNSRMKPHFSVANNRIQLYLNTASPCVGHAEKAVLLSSRLKESLIDTTVVITNGKVLSGNVGTQNQRFHIAAGQAFYKADAILKYAGPQQKVFVDNSIKKQVQGYLYKVVHHLCIKKSDGTPVSFTFFMITGEQGDKNQEWMYSLDQMDSTPEACLNIGFEKMLGGNFAAALESLAKVPKQYEEERTAIEDICRRHGSHSGKANWFKGMLDKNEYEEYVA